MLTVFYQTIRQSRLMIVFVLMTAAGCYPDWPEPASTAVVHGSITLDDSPLPQAFVVFLPNSLLNPNDQLMPLAYGTTDEQGKFQLAYSDGTRDLMAGNYTVIVSKMQSNRDSWNAAFLPDSTFDPTEFNNDELLPPQYNHDSNLTYELAGSPSIVRPVFELSSVGEEIEFELNLPESSD